MKDILLLLIITICMSCTYKSSNKSNDASENAILSNIQEDTIKIDIKKQKIATLILKVKIVEEKGGSKFNWVDVKVLSILKNNTDEQVPDSLSIASFSWLDGLKENNVYIVYLVPFPLGSEKITDINRWLLLEGNGSIGAEFIN